MIYDKDNDRYISNDGRMAIYPDGATFPASGYIIIERYDGPLDDLESAVESVKVNAMDVTGLIDGLTAALQKLPFPGEN